MVRIIGVTGGKGGTGKSTVATALAIELGKRSKVMLVDMDVDCPNDHLILNIKRKELHKVYQRIPVINANKCIKCGACAKACNYNAIVAISDKIPFFMPQQCNGCGACKIVCKEEAIFWNKKEIGVIYSGKAYGIDFYSGELKINEPIAEFVVNELKRIVESKKEKYDYIIADTAAGSKCDVISALGFCYFVFGITEPTPLGEHDVEVIIKLLLRMNKPFEIILNRYEKENEQIISDMLKRYNKSIFAKIPYSKAIMEQYSKGIPVEDESIKKIAEGILNDRFK
ncbi:MAG: ATP-binding protein [archaeon]